MTAYDLVVQGNLVLPEGVLAHGWVAVSGERIAAVGTGEPPPPHEALHRAADAYGIPGVIDGQNWSPYDGVPLKGHVGATFVRGQKVFEDGRVLADPGGGRFVPRIRA